MPYADEGTGVPSSYGALGPARGAMAGLGGAARRQAQPKMSHVKVPISTLIGLLLADAVKPVAQARPRTPQSMLPGLANRVSPPPQPSVGSLASLIQAPRPRSMPMRRSATVGQPGNWF